MIQISKHQISVYHQILLFVKTHKKPNNKVAIKLEDTLYKSCSLFKRLLTDPEYIQKKIKTMERHKSFGSCASFCKEDLIRSIQTIVDQLEPTFKQYKSLFLN